MGSAGQTVTSMLTVGIGVAVGVAVGNGVAVSVGVGGGFVGVFSGNGVAEGIVTGAALQAVTTRANTNKMIPVKRMSPIIVNNPEIEQGNSSWTCRSL